MAGLLNHILHDTPLKNELFSHFGMQALLGLDQTSRSLHAPAKQELEDRLKMPFEWFADAEGMKNVMKATGAVFSGSAILHIIAGLRGGWEPSDLDTYVAPGGWRQLVEYLVVREGYQIKKTYRRRPGGGKDQSGPSESGYYTTSLRIRSVTKLIKVFEGPRGIRIERRMDIVESQTTQAIRPIFDFASTLVMNWMTFDSRVHIMYADLTHSGVGMLIKPFSKKEQNRQLAWAAKYELRGFTCLAGPALLETKCGWACPSVSRSVGDGGCMVVHSGGTGGGGGVSNVCWRLQVAAKGNGNLNSGDCGNAKCPHYHAHVSLL